LLAPIFNMNPILLRLEYNCY